MKIHMPTFLVVAITIALASCSTVPGGAPQFNMKYFGKCGLLHDGDKLVTKYDKKTRKRNAYVLGENCKTSYPNGGDIYYSTFDSLSIEKFLVRGVRTNKEGITRYTIIRKNGARYVSSSRVK
ncbi:hypothetical protein [Rhizobium glycinendophyticum]|uniref:Lipoprotein n=1 Tax=Rhizobium glycinendophyticum TaxID=2589807 RepID=A0A504TMP8_9HYPH|nr:hypothetical protein [Rhizobium glycinendophyticum]TPP03928.1 hypothetical protein FJQ55_22825 [Rhizobium glycinendophyticum]